MWFGLSTHPFSIRLYGGADDGGTVTFPMKAGREPVALSLSTGVYVTTGLRDPTGKVLFALQGTEGSLWLGANQSGGMDPPPSPLA